MRGLRLTILWGFLAGTLLGADSWTLKPESKYTTYKFGDTKVVLDYYASEHRKFPEYGLRFYRGGQLLAQHRDVGFERIFSDRTKSYFLGVSNDGLIKQAYVLFDRDGRLLKVQPHDDKAVHYCEMSATLIRKWYDVESINPDFILDQGRLLQLRVTSCDGRLIDLYGPLPP